MVAALLMGVVAAPKQTAGAFGKITTKNYYWDLKGDKKINIGAWYYGWDIGSMDVVLKNYKVANASKNGYKKISFTLNFTPDEYTLNMIKKAHDYQYFDNEKGDFVKLTGNKYAIEPVAWFAVFDYKDGTALQVKNSHNVTVKNGKWKNSYGKLKKGKGTRYLKKSSTKVEITYPKSYTNMAIAVGGVNGAETNSNKFWKGKCSFFKTEMYKNGAKDKSNAESIHLMRVQ